MDRIPLAGAGFDRFGPSLRGAQRRSNPAFVQAAPLDCFVAPSGLLAMTAPVRCDRNPLYARVTMTPGGA
jgi:hypothetical protein